MVSFKQDIAAFCHVQWQFSLILDLIVRYTSHGFIKVSECTFYS